MIEPLLGAMLVTWWLTNFLVRESGPYNFGNRLRHSLGLFYDEYSECQGKNQIGKALCCFHCTSLWVAIGVIWAQLGYIDIWRALMVSAAVILLDDWRRV